MPGKLEGVVDRPASRLLLARSMAGAAVALASAPAPPLPLLPAAAMAQGRLQAHLHLLTGTLDHVHESMQPCMHAEAIQQEVQQNGLNGVLPSGGEGEGGSGGSRLSSCLFLFGIQGRERLQRIPLADGA